MGQDGEVWAESAGCNVCTIDSFFFFPPLLSLVFETDAHVQIAEVERDAIMEGFGTYPAREIFVGGRKYATMMGCLDMILAKRKVGVCLLVSGFVTTNKPQLRQDGGGCVVKKTGQSVIIAEYMSVANEMMALALVERLADYLISQGY